MATVSKRRALADALREQDLVIPELKDMIAHWPRAVSDNLNKLRQVTERRLNEQFSGKRLRGMSAVDAALFASSWWPYAPYEELCIATNFATWLFAWDDEIDTGEYSNLIDDLSKAAAFRDSTIEYIQECFSGRQTIRGIGPGPLVEAFKPIGIAISQRYTREQADAFINELLRYVRSTQTEQQNHVQGYLPSVKDYIRLRMDSSGVTACLALTELCYRIANPRNTGADDAEMQKIWGATNLIISLTNDILSMKKEIAQGQVDSIIPLLYLESGSLHAAKEAVTQLIADAVNQLDNAESRIMERGDVDLTQRAYLAKMVDGCKYACTGNLYWSLSSSRYNIA